MGLSPAPSTESMASALGSPRRSSQNTGGAATMATKIDSMNGTSNGAACRRADGEWRIYNVSNSGLADNLVTDICQDATGSYWFATANGVSRPAPAEKPAPRP